MKFITRSSDHLEEKSATEPIFEILDFAITPSQNSDSDVPESLSIAITWSGPIDRLRHAAPSEKGQFFYHTSEYVSF